MYYIPSDYDSMYYPVDRYEILRRQQAYEQARRSAFEKQRREEILRRQRLYQEELARRQEEEYRQRLAYQRELARQAQARRDRENTMGVSDDGDDEYVVVRGPGGYLYRVRRADIIETPSPTSQNEEHVQDGKSFERNDKNAKLTEGRTFDTKLVEEKPLDGNHFQQQSRCAAEFTKMPSKHPKSKKKITVIVEEASDSEDEVNEMNSLWRNRHPSPGESWMEPIGSVM